MHKVQRLAGAVAILALASPAVHAQENSGRGFLFGAPSGSITVRGGYASPTAGSDIFSFVTQQLSVSKRDFSSMTLGVDLAFAIRPRLDVVLSYDASGMNKKSDFRDWQDSQGNPIEQTTSFSRQAWMASVRYWIMPPGREVSRYAWVPMTWAPWVSAGIGRTNYEFKQSGDFIDFKDNNKVFPDTFDSSDGALSEQLSAGVDWSLTERFALTTQAKYLFGRAQLGTDFSGFKPIDLSGFGLTVGLTTRF